MKTRKKLTPTQLAVIVLLGIALACLVSVLNGVYTPGRAIGDTDAVPAAFVDWKVARAELYGYAALVCTALSFVLILKDWLRGSQSAS
ncbi:hypothetical protein [Corynebacterium casei]|uniref:hypothetical protein n=1 Tax=Corynebacterium casei TaxID=160386 RepID=UPI0023F3B80B|nr:hypothetical protein [Corynebacterium casei]